MIQELRILIYAIFLISSGSLTTRAQFPVGIYDLNTSALFHYDSLQYDNTSLVLTANSNFLLEHKPLGISCLTWSRYTGEWEYKDSLLVLTETTVWQPEGLYIKMNKYSFENHIKLRIIDDAMNPLKNLNVTFVLDKCSDSIILESDNSGFVVLDLDTIHSKLKCSTNIIGSGKLSISYLDPTTKENKHKVIYFHSPSDIEVILITSSKEEKLIRKVFYKTISDKLVFLGAYFNSPLFTPEDSQMFIGEFKYRNVK
jgi:hypothetical protein